MLQSELLEFLDETAMLRFV
jgi:hypothetical protein